MRQRISLLNGVLKMSEPVSTYELTKLQHSEDRKGPWRLYIFEPHSEFHRGGVWFSDKPKYPEEGEITTAQALTRCANAVSEGREVRVCDGGDMLVYHFREGRVLHGATFWKDVMK